MSLDIFIGLSMQSQRLIQGHSSIMYIEQNYVGRENVFICMWMIIYGNMCSVLWCVCMNIIMLTKICQMCYMLKHILYLMQCIIISAQLYNAKFPQQNLNDSTLFKVCERNIKLLINLGEENSFAGVLNNQGKRFCPSRKHQYTGICNGK